MIHKNFIINVKLFADRFIQIKNGTFAEIKNTYSGETKFICNELEIINSVFSKPCLSSVLGIYIVQTTNRASDWSVDQIKSKVLALPHAGNYICFPLSIPLR